MDVRTISTTGRVILAGCLAACILLLAHTGRAAAQETPPPPDTGEASFQEQEAGGPRITIHGYLSQAYAATDGNLIAGIPEEGTADYRTAALQIRADLGKQDTFALQLSHERLGESGLQAFQDDVALDWLFYERRFGNSAVKVGRVQIPFGIYNEVRDVGTLLPFYRPSTNFYGEGAYTSETVDGIVLSHTFALGGAWQLDGDLHYGNWEFINRSGAFFKLKVRNSIGVELWLDTPVPGLRIGAGGMRYDVLEPDGNRWKTYHVSLEEEIGRFVSHVEYKKIDFAEGTYDAGYIHLGVQATDKITVNGQYEYSDLNIDFFREGDFDDDTALGVNYAFRPDLVLKLEHHWNEGYTPEDPPQNFFAPKPETRYWIVSLSTSF
ncbi:MAG TPA: hypothetical protein VGX68_08585 [Thermoanaerobaculia bacterium]|nr:hypothetical protein [Thermoanaerobaculia bacterium]